MRRETVSAVAEDLLTLVEFLKDARILPSAPGAKVLQHVKRVHFASYSLILWKFRLAGIAKHARPFVEEIASDALQIVPQALMGYSKTTQLLTRGIIENCLRHIYFSDHPVEFLKMNRSAKWYLKFEELTDYVATHPDLIATQKSFKPVDRLKTLYSDLSGGVHGRRVQDLEMRVALHKIHYEEKSIDARVRDLAKCAESVNLLLIAFHRQKFLHFPRPDRQTILRTISPAGRRLLSALPIGN